LGLEHEKMGKGVTLSSNELKDLKELLNNGEMEYGFNNSNRFFYID